MPRGEATIVSSGPRLTRSLLESWFPSLELSLLAQADRRADDPAYATHRWWARRPPSVFRAMLIASVLEGGSTESRFWELFGSSSDLLQGLQVHDPFCGGGTTLVEGARLGARVSGSDVDPLAVEITSLALSQAGSAAVASAGRSLTTYLEGRLGELWPTGGDSQALHYFYLTQVTCPACKAEAYLHRGLILARSTGLSGAVRRDSEVVAFCPSCLQLHDLRVDSGSVTCCGTDWAVDQGNFEGQRFHCPSCGAKAQHGDLQTGTAPRRLLAVEETRVGGYRTFRTPTEADLGQIHLAASWVSEHQKELKIPRSAFVWPRVDARPVSYGMTRYQDCFSDRQLATFGLAFSWIDQTTLDAQTRRALRLAVSSALSSNNRLCGYATDYGRLSPIFSIRGYALPVVQVELNPLHRSGGRGSLRSVIRSIVRASQATGRRYLWDPVSGRAEPIPIRSGWARGGEVVCAGASEPHAYPTDGVDLLIFDPPYFDYIAYHELSEFYRSWLDDMPLVGVPLHPHRERPAESFGSALAACMRQMVAVRRSGYPLSFTYHSAHRAAWEALGRAVDEAGLVVTALWPVRNDAHMGLHTFAGNCEWDVIVVCRPEAECTTASGSQDVEQWLSSVRPLPVSEADQQSFHLAIEMASTRSGSVREE